MAALSNAAFSGRVLMRELGRHGLATFLRFVIASADVGLRKPAPAVYRMALRRLDAESRNAWFIGDTLDEDISGAIEVGLTAFLLQPTPAPGNPGDGYKVVRSWEELYDAYAAAAGHSFPR